MVRCATLVLMCAALAGMDSATAGSAACATQPRAAPAVELLVLDGMGTRVSGCVPPAFDLRNRAACACEEGGTGERSKSAIVWTSDGAIFSAATAFYRTHDRYDVTQELKRWAYVRAHAKAQTGVSAFHAVLADSQCKRVGERGASEVLDESTVTEALAPPTPRRFVLGLMEQVHDNAPVENSVTVILKAAESAADAARAAARTSIAEADRGPMETHAGFADTIFQKTFPVGVGIVCDLETDDLWILGYGSAVAITHPDRSLARGLRVAAERQAELRALQALASLLADGTSVEAAGDGQVVYARGPRTVRLPPGLLTKTLLAGDGHWVYATTVLRGKVSQTPLLCEGWRAGGRSSPRELPK